MHLAQLNIARFAAPIGSPEMADFRNNLDRVNALADRMPGFVWRLQGEDGNAIGIPWTGDPALAVNLSVWESVEALETYVFGTLHRSFYARRDAWFRKVRGHHFVMWWVPEGHVPDLAEAADRLEHLEAHGSGDRAFGWDHVPSLTLWQAARCPDLEAV